VERSVTDVSALLLTALLNYGNTLLGTTLFLAAFGIPLPATMLLMAAGAFIRQGVLPIEGAILAGISGAIAGDACSYLVGRFSLQLVPASVQASGNWQGASALFARWGGWSVFVSRFLLTPVALPVNLLAGSTRYAWTRFMTAVVAGEIIWVFLFGGLGYLFANQWEVLSGLAGDVSWVLLGIVLVLAGVWIFVSGRKRVRGGV